MDNNDKLSYEAMTQEFRNAIEKKHNPSYGLDDSYSNYATEEQVTQPNVENIYASTPTTTELNEYNERREEAPNIALQTARDDAYNKRVDSLLASVSDHKDNPQEESSLIKITDLPVYEVIGRKPAKITTKEVEPAKKAVLNKITKDVVKKVGLGLVIVGVSAGAVKGGISVLTQPDPVVPKINPYTTEQEEKEMEEAYDRAHQGEKDYTTYYDKNGKVIVYDRNDEGERKKVIQIMNQEEKYTQNPTKGGRQ